MNALLAALALILPSPELTYAWSPPKGGGVEHYEILLIQQGLPPQPMVTTATTVTIRPEIGRNTRVQVRACSSAGCGEWSDHSQQVSANLSADYNGDGIVGLPDLTVLADQIGQPGTADLTGDGLVGPLDLQAWQERIGQCIGPVSVDGVLLEAYLPCELVSR